MQKKENDSSAGHESGRSVKRRGSSGTMMSLCEDLQQEESASAMIGVYYEANKIKKIQKTKGRSNEDVKDHCNCSD